MEVKKERKSVFKVYYPKHKTMEIPFVSIRLTGMRLGKLCFPAFRNKPFVELYYNEYLKTIAIKPYQIETPFTLKTGIDRKKRILQIRCMGFIKEAGIHQYLKFEPFSNIKSMRFKAVWDDKEKWFVIDLKNKLI